MVFARVGVRVDCVSELVVDGEAELRRGGGLGRGSEVVGTGAGAAGAAGVDAGG